ncbi:MAG: prepilin-type N-terminal cleavage/methylation domain-containing protein [Candidatus Omnitrophica bacterium]|nr:prepilin-type N-terminal cleavage/methylation domain-containing protein [Candidatus Omnitrophota bacterium]
MYHKERNGFTIVEMITVAAILAMIFAGLALPRFFKSKETASRNACLQNRNIIEQSEQRYFFDKGTHSAVLQDLVDSGYLKSIPSCPSGGVYAWEASGQVDSSYELLLGCSVHTQAEPAEEEPAVETDKSKGKSEEAKAASDAKKEQKSKK